MKYVTKAQTYQPATATTVCQKIPEAPLFRMLPMPIASAASTTTSSAWPFAPVSASTSS